MGNAQSASKLNTPSSSPSSRHQTLSDDQPPPPYSRHSSPANVATVNPPTRRSSQTLALPDRRATRSTSAVRANSLTVPHPPVQRRSSSHGVPGSSRVIHASVSGGNLSVRVQSSNGHTTNALRLDTSLQGSEPRVTRASPQPRITVSPVPSSGAEEPLQLLQKYDTAIIIDDSSSMAGRRWREVRDALAAVADLASKHSIEGISLYFLNDRRTLCNVKSAAAVIALFDSAVPDGATPTGEKLEELLLVYLDKLETGRDQGQIVRPVNLIVLTDGVPSDDPESVIVTAAKRLDSQHFPLSQVGIQFVQIGSDPEATASLQELDDGLAAAHGIRDIVDTTPYSGATLTAETLTKILLGGINRRVDKQSH